VQLGCGTAVDHYEQSDQEDEASERISLTLPDGARFATVARIVVGGLAARHGLSYENLDDLQLAVETVLASHAPDNGEITLELTVLDDIAIAHIGPVDASKVAEELARDDELGLRVVLSAVVDTVSFDIHDGAQWLCLKKRVHSLPAH
jgi:hypothetical protein